MYLLTFTIQGQLLLALSKDNAIQAYETIEDVMKAFEGFTGKFGSGDYESATSATIGMMNIQPQAIEFNEPAEILKPFLLAEKGLSYSGMMGVLGSIEGVPLDPKFLEGKHTISVWKESMIAAGIADPLESEVTNPINFSL